MKKTVFANNVFYNLVFAYLCILILYNIYIIVTGNLWGLLPVAIQLTVLILMMIKSRYIKSILLIWAIVFLITASVLQLAGSFFTGLQNGFANYDLTACLTQLFALIAGILIADYTKRTVTVVFNETPEFLQSKINPRMPNYNNPNKNSQTGLYVLLIIAVGIFLIFKFKTNSTPERSLIDQTIAGIRFGGRVVAFKYDATRYHNKIAVLSDVRNFSIYSGWVKNIALGDSLAKAKGSMQVIVYKPAGAKVVLDYAVLLNGAR